MNQLSDKLVDLIIEHANALNNKPIKDQTHHITLLDSLIKICKDELK